MAELNIHRNDDPERSINWLKLRDTTVARKGDVLTLNSWDDLGNAPQFTLKELTKLRGRGIVIKHLALAPDILTLVNGHIDHRNKVRGQNANKVKQQRNAAKRERGEPVKDGRTPKESDDLIRQYWQYVVEGVDTVQTIEGCYGVPVQRFRNRCNNLGLVWPPKQRKTDSGD